MGEVVFDSAKCIPDAVNFLWSGSAAAVGAAGAPATGAEVAAAAAAAATEAEGGAGHDVAARLSKGDVAAMRRRHDAWQRLVAERRVTARRC